MKKIFSYLSYFILMFIFLAALPSKTKAVTNGIQISPLTFNMEIPQSGTGQGKIIVTNQNDDTLNYVIEVENFAGVTDDGSVAFAGKEEEGAVTTLADWFTFDSPKEGEIAPHKDKEIGFTINMPVDAEPGGHYAAVFAREVRKNPDGKTIMGVASRVGVLVLVSVPGETKKSAEITEFTYPKFVWRGPNNLSMKVSNTGTVHYDSKGSVELKNLFGNLTSIDMGTHTIIPKNARNYNGTWLSKYPFGYYQVTAKAQDGNGNFLTTSGVIWAIPLMIVIPVIIGLILLILIIRYLKRHLQFKP